MKDSTKVADVGKAIEILWGNYSLTDEQPTFEGFIKWLRSMTGGGYAGSVLETELNSVRPSC